MAQMQFQREFRGEQLQKIIVKNPNGRIVIHGWDNPFIRVDARVEAAGTAVPKEVLPRITENGSSLTILCGAGINAVPDDLDIHGIMEKAGDIGEGIRSSFEQFLSDSIPGDREEREEIPDEEDQDEEKFEDTLDSLPQKLKHLKQVIIAAVKDKKDKGIWMMGMKDVKTDLEISVPVHLEIKAKSLNGVIVCENLKGSMNLKATNGPIRLQSITGEIDVKTMNGPIAMESSAPKKLNARTLNGPIKTVLTQVVGDVHLKTLNGPVRVVIPVDSSVDLEVRTVSSPVKVPSGFHADTKSQTRFSGHLGSGGFPMKIKTISGPVTVVIDDRIPEENSIREEIRNQPSPSETKEDPVAIVDRLVRDGKITEQEAEKLRSML